MSIDLRELAADERGATLVEYGLVVGLIAGAAIIVLTALGKGITGIFNGILPWLQPPP
jgi:Flp pilus assembly pilin Flp